MAKGIIVTVCLVLVVVFGFQNLTPVPLRLIFGNPIAIGLTYIIGISFAAGAVLSFIFGALIKYRTDKHHW